MKFRRREYRGADKRRGFTLIELVVVVAIVAILTAIAVPSYQRYVLKSRRTEAMGALQQVQNGIEKFLLTTNAYPTSIAQLDPVVPTGLKEKDSQWLTSNEYYQVSLTVLGSAPTTITATAQNGQTQDEQCSQFTLFLNGQRKAKAKDGTDSSAVCWPD